MLEEWISAAEAFRRVSAATSEYGASRAICSRAYAGLIQAKAAKFIIDDRSHEEFKIPQEFWWACGEAALEQDWLTGDFETWIDRKTHGKAFGVSFSRGGIEALIGPAIASRDASPTSRGPSGGRPAAAWWDDLWIEMCRKLWTGELQPKKQSDIKSAMMNWASVQGHDPADSTIRARARKLWTVLKKQDEN